MLVFVPRWLFLSWEVFILFLMLLSQFPVTFCHTQMGCPILSHSLDYSCAAWDGLHDHLRDVPWEDIFKLGAPAATKER